MKNFNSILLIDDDEASNFLSKRIINNMNLCNKIYVAENGKEALDLLKDENSLLKALSVFPDLILLDINMPVMDGFQFLNEFNSLKTEMNTKIIILTSSNNTSDINNAKRFNITGYLNKPITKEKLLQLI